MSDKLLTEHHLEFLSLKGGYTGLSKSTLVKMPHCWKSHVMAHITTVHMVTALVYKDKYHCPVRNVSTSIISSNGKDDIVSHVHSFFLYSHGFEPCAMLIFLTYYYFPLQIRRFLLIIYTQLFSIGTCDTFLRSQKR